MSTSTLLALGLIGAVALLALWLRSQSESAPPANPAPPPPLDDPSPEVERDENDGEWDIAEAAAVTVDGLAFIPEEHRIALVRTPDPHEAVPGPIVPVEFLRPGDFSGARVVRGTPGADPWRLELLGPDGEYMAFGFEVEEAARVALSLLEKHEVMEYVRNDDGRPVVPSGEQFEEAKRRYDETERLLALGDEESPEPLH